MVQLKDDGYRPSDPALFYKNISSLSAALASQMMMVAPSTDSFLFDQPLLEKVVSSMKEDSLISSTASLASLSKAASRGRSGSSGADKYTSPLDHPRAGSSGYHKRSASPVRGFASKSGRRGRDKGFRK